jgi:hypothetical protein
MDENAGSDDSAGEREREREGDHYDATGEESRRKMLHA